MSKATTSAAAAATSSDTQQQKHRYVESAALKQRIKRFVIPSSSAAAAYLPKQHQPGAGFRDNQKICQDGGVKAGGVYYKFFESISPATLFTYDGDGESQDDDAELLPAPRFPVTEYCVVECDTVTTSLAMLRDPNDDAAGSSDTMGVDGSQLAAHNFANATNPGGYYSCGTVVRAQEETICAQLPDLFPSLEAARALGLYPIPTNAALISTVSALRHPSTREICLTRSAAVARSAAERKKPNDDDDDDDDDDASNSEKSHQSNVLDFSAYPGLGQFKVISSAMPIHGGKRPAGGYLGESSSWRHDVEPRVRATLGAALAAGCTTFVGGAAGAGAFGNPPKAVAEIFKSVLASPQFRGKFRFVVFAIVDPMGTGNLRPFSEGIAGMK